MARPSLVEGEPGAMTEVSFTTRIASKNYFFDRFSMGCEANVEVSENRIERPMRLNFQRVASVSLSRVHSIALFRVRSLEVLIIGSTRSLPICIRNTDLADSSNLGRIESELRRSISNLPNGVSIFGRIDQRSHLLNRLCSLPWFTLGVVAVLALIHGLVNSPIGPHTPEERTRSGALVSGLVASGDWFRLVTAMLLHIDWSHWIQNSIHCLGVGWIVEASIGPKRLGLLVFTTGVLGNLAVQILNTFVDESQVHVEIGSSGAVWGVLGAVSILSVSRRQDFPVGFRSPWPVWIVLALSIYAQRTEVSQVVTAHLVGGLTGVILMMGSIRGNRRLPLVSNAQLTPVAVIAGSVVILSIGMAIRNDQLFGSKPYFSLVRDQLASSDVSDETRDYAARVIASTASAPTELLQFALETMEQLVVENPATQFRVTLAVLYYRAGELHRAAEITRNLYRAEPEQPLGSLLSQLYQSLIEERWYGANGSALEVLSGVRVDVSTSEYGGGLVFETTLSSETTATMAMHGILLRDRELYGLIEMIMQPGTNSRQCVFHSVRLGGRRVREMSVRPVWIGEIASGTVGDDTICRLERNLGELEHLE
jgi:membrane associated rhomboid family serine protease